MSEKKGWIIADELLKGDMLLLKNGDCTPVEEVADFHKYYVGNNSILVHNVRLKSQAKKIDPLRLKNEFNLLPVTFHREIKQTIITKAKPNYKVEKT